MWIWLKPDIPQHTHRILCSNHSFDYFFLLFFKKRHRFLLEMPVVAGHWIYIVHHAHFSNKNTMGQFAWRVLGIVGDHNWFYLSRSPLSWRRLNPGGGSDTQFAAARARPFLKDSLGGGACASVAQYFFSLKLCEDKPAPKRALSITQLWHEERRNWHNFIS